MAGERMHTETAKNKQKAWEDARKFRNEKWGGRGNIAVTPFKVGNNTVWRWTITR